MCFQFFQNIEIKTSQIILIKPSYYGYLKNDAKKHNDITYKKFTINIIVNVLNSILTRNPAGHERKNV